MLPETLIAEIIKEQSQIIGENLAKSRAEKSGIVTFNSAKLDDLTIKLTPQEAIEKLIGSFEEVFGRASVEVCMDVIRRHPTAEVSAILPDRVKAYL
jgi:hypothetical protein